MGHKSAFGDTLSSGGDVSDMSVYDQRPWLFLYPVDMPSAIESDFANALDMFKASAARGQDRPFLHYFTSTITFGEADRLSDWLAVGLQKLEVVPGDRVAVYLQNIPQFVIAELATWKLGGTMVPVNPMLKKRELEFALRDSRANVLITLESSYHDVVVNVLENTPIQIVVTTSELDLIDGPPPSLLDGIERRRPDDAHDLFELAHAHEGESPQTPSIAPDDVAFLTYTSGTTGPPKGAMNTHGNVVFNARSYRDWIQLDEKDIVLGVSPLFHITGLIANVAVATLVTIPLVLTYRFDAEVILDAIERRRATFTVASITVFIALTNHRATREHDISSLSKVYSGGAPIAPATVDAYEKRFGTYIHAVYGLTETTSPTHMVPFGRRAPVDSATGALSVGDTDLQHDLQDR
jgi:long-chain acyl-CoA synthetase